MRKTTWIVYKTWEPWRNTKTREKTKKKQQMTVTSEETWTIYTILPNADKTHIHNKTSKLLSAVSLSTVVANVVLCTQFYVWHVYSMRTVQFYASEQEIAHGSLFGCIEPSSNIIRMCWIIKTHFYWSSIIDKRDTLDDMHEQIREINTWIPISK